MTDKTQQVINRMSLVMTIPEDVVKACRAHDFSPAFVETMLRLHNQQVELEKAINELRQTQFEMAKVIETFTGFATTLQENIVAIGNHAGFNASEHVTVEEIGQD